MATTTVELDEIRIALELAGRVVNGSVALSSLDEEITSIMDAEEIDEDRREAIETLVRSFWLFGRNVQVAADASAGPRNPG